MDAIEQARALMPAWIGWGLPAGYLLMAAAGSALAVRVAVLLAYRGRRRLADAHWTERARAAYPARVATGLAMLALPAFFGAMAWPFTGPLARVPVAALGSVAGAFALLAVAQVHRKLQRQVLPRPPSLGYWLAGVAVMWLVVAPLLPMVLLLVALCPLELLGWRGALWLLGGVLLLFGAVRGWGLRLAAATHLARPAGTRLSRLVAAAAERAGRPPPPTYELRWPLANALAFPMAGLLAFSDAVLEALDDDEIAAVAAHELGHLGEPRTARAARTALAASFLPLAAARGVIHRWGLPGYLAVFCAVLVVLVLVRRVARRMEQRADAHAVEQQQGQGGYARALGKIYRFNAVPAVLSKRAIHPALYDRVLAAGGAPSYARPEAPRRWLAHLGLGAGMVLAALLLVGSYLALWWWPAEADAEVPQWIDLAAGHGDGYTLAWLGDMRWQRQQLAEAAVLYAAAAELDDTAPDAAPRLATVLLLQGRCEEALAVMQRVIAQRGQLEGGSLVWPTALPCASAPLPMPPLP